MTLVIEGSPCRKKELNRGLFLPGKGKNEGSPCLEKEPNHRLSLPGKDCVSSFSPEAPAEAMPKFLLHLLPLTSQFSPAAPAEALPRFPSDIAKKIRLRAAGQGGGGGGGGVRHWNLTHGQWSKNLTMTTDTLEFPPWSIVKTVI